MAIGSPGSSTNGLTPSCSNCRSPSKSSSDDADGAAAVDVTPHGVAHAENEPSLALRDEPVLGLLQFRLGNHDSKVARMRWWTSSSLPGRRAVRRRSRSGWGACSCRAAIAFESSAPRSSHPASPRPVAFTVLLRPRSSSIRDGARKISGMRCGGSGSVASWRMRSSPSWRVSRRTRPSSIISFARSVPVPSGPGYRPRCSSTRSTASMEARATTTQRGSAGMSP